MLFKQRNSLFLQVWWVGGYRLVDKWLEPQNCPEIRGFCHRGPPTKEVSTFLIIIAKVRSSQTFLCRKFVSNVFGLGSVAY